VVGVGAPHLLGRIRLGRLPGGDGEAEADEVLGLNPIYGQGMTIAALQAEALGRHLARHGRLRPRRYQRQVARILRPVWEMAAGADLQHPGVAGRRTRSQRLLGAYVARLQAAAAHDSSLSAAFAEVVGLARPPQSLLRPAVAIRVLRR
jgi:hypothetical protein